MVVTTRDRLGAPAPANARLGLAAGGWVPSRADPSDADLYRAYVSRDARFDGRFFVGVTSTGVYCRPVCRVRTPQARNCRFFGSAALAEAQGFRPCLRCRPELAPGLSMVDSPDTLALHAVRLIDSAITQSRELAPRDLAMRLGVSDRHLRRIFLAAFGVSPIDYLTTRRLLMAKQLLTDTTLPVTQVALASGFASVRRFNAAFAQRYALRPSTLRQHRAAARIGSGADGNDEQLPDDAVRLRLGWRPPYDVNGVLEFISRRALTGVEAVGDRQIARTLEVSVRGQPTAGWIVCRFDPDRHQLRVAVAAALAPALGEVTARVRRWLDLDADPQPIAAALASLPVEGRAGVRLVGGPDGFETAVRVVLGQQVSVAAARTLTQRLVDALGRPIDGAPPGLVRLFPTPCAVATADADRLASLGITRSRVRALQALANAVRSGLVDLHPAAALADTLAALRSLPGFGEWSVQMIAMRALGWPDAFAPGDAAVLRALCTRDVRRVEQLAQSWRPWRAYAQVALMNTPKEIS